MKSKKEAVLKLCQGIKSRNFNIIPNDKSFCGKREDLSTELLIELGDP